MSEPSTSAVDEGGIRITRVFDAPREEVFRAWTEPSSFAEWFGGREAPIPVSSVAMDVRPGGAWAATMQLPDGNEIAWHGVYREVVEPERLVLTLSDQPGGDDADEDPVTVAFGDLGNDTTEMVFHQGGHLPEEERGRAREGWSRFFDRMAELLAER